MVRSISIFAKLLFLFSRTEFARHVVALKAERYAKGFRARDQFVAMLFCQLAQAKSPREITGGLKACAGKLKHLGMPDAPARSTLVYANAHRPREVFGRIFTIFWGVS